MNAWLARLLTRLYPHNWKRRYGTEFETFLQNGPAGVRTSIDIVWSALCERFNPTQGLDAQRETHSRHFQFLWVRAPWALFSLAPVALLGTAYFLACFILWSGWRFFLPGMTTPFVPIDGFAIFYFGVGRLLYYTAPILVAWIFAVISVRLGTKTVWPMMGLVLIAMLGGTAHVHANPPVAHHAVGSISMQFAFGSLFLGTSNELVHALVILWLGALPHVVWRLQKIHWLPPK